MSRRDPDHSLLPPEDDAAHYAPLPGTNRTNEGEREPRGGRRRARSYNESVNESARVSGPWRGRDSPERQRSMQGGEEEDEQLLERVILHVFIVVM